MLRHLHPGQLAPRYSSGKPGMRKRPQATEQETHQFLPPKKLLTRQHYPEGKQLPAGLTVAKPRLQGSIQQPRQRKDQL